MHCGSEQTRCQWVNLKNELSIDYHDHEWGIPVYDDNRLFEMLILEGAQAGLSWETILNKRQNYREAFDNFDVKKISLYDDDKQNELLQNQGIIRNKLKIKSAIQNANAFLEIQNDYGSFNEYIWNFINHKPITNNVISLLDIPTSSGLSDIISRDLKKKG